MRIKQFIGKSSKPGRQGNAGQAVRNLDQAWVKPRSQTGGRTGLMKVGRMRRAQEQGTAMDRRVVRRKQNRDTGRLGDGNRNMDQALGIKWLEGTLACVNTAHKRQSAGNKGKCTA